MSVFNQKNQKVKGDQTNIAGDQYNNSDRQTEDSIKNLEDLAKVLEKLQKKVSSAKEAELLSAEKATDINYSLQKAIDQSKSKSTKGGELLENLNKAKSLVSGIASVGGIAVAIEKIVNAAKSIL